MYFLSVTNRTFTHHKLCTHASHHLCISILRAVIVLHVYMRETVQACSINQVTTLHYIGGTWKWGYIRVISILIAIGYYIFSSYFWSGTHCSDGEQLQLTDCTGQKRFQFHKTTTWLTLSIIISGKELSRLLCFLTYWGNCRQFERSILEYFRILSFLLLLK